MNEEEKKQYFNQGSRTEETFRNDTVRTAYYNMMLFNNNMPGYNTQTINSFRGFNPFNTGPAMMRISDAVIGFMFLTKPHLNLSDANLVLSEKLISLLDAEQNDLAGFIRGTLDKTWATATFGDDEHPMLDNRMPFISCLNEYLKTSTGFSDLRLQMKTTEPGLRQQVYQFVGSKLEENGHYNLQQTYYSPKPLLIQTLFQHWLTYISEVKIGDNGLSPYWQYLVANRCDHDCRIYHMVMNVDTEYLESIFATVQAIPETFPVGGLADFDRTQPSKRAQGQDDFSIQFSCVGMRFDELSLIRAFNEHVYYFNPDLQRAIELAKDGDSTYRFGWRQLNPSEYLDNRYRMYPLLLVVKQERKISSITMKQSFRQGIKLTWWVREGKNNGAV